jgi:hypothetical protein
MVAELGYSVNAAAIQLGLPVGQAVRYLKMEGVEYKRRPRVLNPEKESALRQFLGSGEDREFVASTLSIRKAFIKDYLGQDPILRDAWMKANLAKQTEKYRQHLMQLLSEHPNVSIKRLKRIPGNGVQWLDRHDREWLENSLPSLWKRGTSTVNK